MTEEWNRDCTWNTDSAERNNIGECHTDSAAQYLLEKALLEVSELRAVMEDLERRIAYLEMSRMPCTWKRQSC